jgi:hypothetical protein
MTYTQSNWQAEAGAGGYRGDRQTGWATYLVFAGVMLGLVGLFHAMAGLTALFDDEAYAVRSDGLVIRVDYTAWGWAHLLLGVLAIVAAFLLMRGNTVGRMAGVAIAAVSAVANFAFVAANPLWAAAAITFDVLVIYAICAHGGELRSNR